MSKAKTHTVATFELRLTVPTGSNIAAADRFIRSAILAEIETIKPGDPWHGITVERFVLKLVKKEVTYA